jgi:tRNA pseudouridine32 synthase / 23S rRNA pseudouridine746 synthase
VTLEPPPLRILHQDDSIVVLDKPAGVCVIPPRAVDVRDCLRHMVEQELGSKVYVVHRLDRDTSGVVLMARTADAHRALNDAFAARQVTKTYRALVSSEPPEEAGVVDVALAAGRKGRMRPAQPGEDGLAASTRYRVIERYPAVREGPAGASLMEFEPHTGRQHQIRVHARHLGCPILGDRLYASQVVRERAPRLMLHALGIRFRHPADGAATEFLAPLPADFESVRQRLANV